MLADWRGVCKALFTEWSGVSLTLFAVPVMCLSISYSCVAKIAVWCVLVSWRWAVTAFLVLAFLFLIWHRPSPSLSFPSLSLSLSLPSLCLLMTSVWLFEMDKLSLISCVKTTGFSPFYFPNPHDLPVGAFKRAIASFWEFSARIKMSPLNYILD